MVHRIVNTVLSLVLALVVLLLVFQRPVRRLVAGFLCDSAAVFVAHNQWYEALDAYDMAVSTDPTLPEAWLGRASSRLRTSTADHDVMTSLVDVNHAITLQPTAAAYERRSAIRLFQGDAADAVADASSALGLEPQFVDAWRTRSEARAQQGDGQGSLEDLTQALKLAPDQPALHAALAYAHLDLHQNAEALQDANQAVAAEPDNAAYRLTRSAVEEATLDLDAAGRDIAAAVHLQPRWSRVYESRANLALCDGDVPDALTDCNHLVDMAPNQAASYSARALVERFQAQFDKALQDADHAVTLEPHDASVRGEKAAVEYEMANWQGAADDYRAAAEPGLANRGSWAYYQFFEWLARARLGQQAAATQDLRTVLTAHPISNPWPRAVSEYLLGRRDEGSLLHLAADAGERCEACFYVGCKHELQGDMTQARHWFTESVATRMALYFEYRAAQAALTYR